MKKGLMILVMGGILIYPAWTVACAELYGCTQSQTQAQTVNIESNTPVTVINTPGETKTPLMSTATSEVKVESQPVDSDTGAFRQYPETVQPKFPPLTHGGKDASWRVLDDLNWLPPVLERKHLTINKTQKCRLNPKLLYQPARTTSTVHAYTKSTIPPKYNVIGYVSGSCPGGDTFDLDFRIRELAMDWGGDGVIYIQSGKGEKPTAWSVGLFGGGVTASLGGASKDKSISVSGGLGFTYGTAELEEFPGLIGIVVAVPYFYR